LGKDFNHKVTESQRENPNLPSVLRILASSWLVIWFWLVQVGFPCPIEAQSQTKTAAVTIQFATCLSQLAIFKLVFMPLWGTIGNENASRLGAFALLHFQVRNTQCTIYITNG
jgi:hypothetical protein